MWWVIQDRENMASIFGLEKGKQNDWLVIIKLKTLVTLPRESEYNIK